MSGNDVVLHPVEKCFAVSGDGVPGGVEGVVAAVVAVGVGWVCAAWGRDDSGNCPIWQDGGVRTGNAQIVGDLFHRYDHTFGGERGFLLDSDDSLEEYVSGAVCTLGVNDGEVGPDGGDGGKLFSGEGALDEPDARVDSDEIRALVASEDRAGQASRTGCVGIRHRCMAVLLQLQGVRPTVLDRVAQAVKHAYTRVAAPGEHEPTCATHADELVVNKIGRHAYEAQVALVLADDLVTGGEGDQMGEALHSDGGTIVDVLGNGFVQRKKSGHFPCSII